MWKLFTGGMGLEVLEVENSQTLSHSFYKYYLFWVWFLFLLDLARNYRKFTFPNLPELSDIEKVLCMLVERNTVRTAVVRNRVILWGILWWGILWGTLLRGTLWGTLLWGILHNFHILVCCLESWSTEQRQTWILENSKALQTGSSIKQLLKSILMHNMTSKNVSFLKCVCQISQNVIIVLVVLT